MAPAAAPMYQQPMYAQPGVVHHQQVVHHQPGMVVQHGGMGMGMHPGGVVYAGGKMKGYKNKG
jgi:hypothetical protein